MINRYQPVAALKDNAKGFLNGKYGRAVRATMIYLGMNYVISWIASEGTTIIKSLFVASNLTSVAASITASVLSNILSAVASLIVGVFSVGFALFYLKLGSNHMPGVSDVFAGFREGFARSVLVVLGESGAGIICSIPAFVLIETFLDGNRNVAYLQYAAAFGVCSIILGIIFSLNFRMAYFIMADFPEYSAGEALMASMRKMRGHKLRFLGLQLSFIPLLILGLLSLGVGLLWINPLMQETYAQFYLDLMNPRQATGEWERTV